MKDAEELERQRRIEIGVKTIGMLGRFMVLEDRANELLALIRERIRIHEEAAETHRRHERELIALVRKEIPWFGVAPARVDGGDDEGVRQC